MEPKVRNAKFVAHIVKHLKELGIQGKVCCKICGKTIDEIAEEANQ